MKNRVAGGVLLAVIVSLQAFGQVGVWGNHTSMQSIQAIARSADTLWAATKGGLFAWKVGTESYKKFTSAEGLQTTDLTAVAIDNSGNIWTGATSGSVSVYTQSSGSWRYIEDIKNSPDLIDKRINAISVYGDTVLICTNSGLSVFRVSRFTFGDTYKRFGSLVGIGRLAVMSAALFDNKIWAVVWDGQGTNRVASGAISANLLQPENWNLENVGNIPRQLAVFNTKLHVTSAAGLFSLSGNAWLPINGVQGIALKALSASVTRLGCVSDSGDVYTIDQQNSVTRLSQRLATPPGSIAITHADEVAVGTSANGIATYVINAWTYHFPNGPASNQFLSIAVDLDGNVWGATGVNAGGKGFYRLDATTKNWKSFSRASGTPLPFDDYHRVSVGCNGDVWLGSWGRGTLLMPRGSTTVDSSNHFGTNVGISGIVGYPDIVVIGPAVCDNRGYTWMPVMNPANRRCLALRSPNGTWSTLPVDINGTAISYLTEQEISRSLVVDASNNIWASAVFFGTKGVLCLNNRGSISDSIANVLLTTSNGLPSNEVRTIVIDRDNDIWVGTDRGIAIILDPDNPTRAGAIASYKPLLGTPINAIAVDALNQKWVATNDGVVLLSRDGTQTLGEYDVKSTQGKIIANEVRDIAIDQKTGTVYFATQNGLASVTTTSAQPRETFDELSVYPNPFRIPSTTPLVIDGLVENSKVKILSVDGHLVRDLLTPGGRIGFWDGKDDDGKDVASGIYIVVGYSDSDKNKTGKGKVAVLRK